jgi:hypothetical protein
MVILAPPDGGVRVGSAMEFSRGGPRDRSAAAVGG